MLVASANPEDYTNRGRIITPLKDRFGAQIRTHYPLDVDTEIAAVIDQEGIDAAGPGGVRVEVPKFMAEIIATPLAAGPPEPHDGRNQRSGVSGPLLSVTNYGGRWWRQRGAAGPASG